MKYRIKSFLLFTLMIYSGLADAQYTNGYVVQFPDSGGTRNRFQTSIPQAVSGKHNSQDHSGQYLNKLHYFNLGYLLPAWGIDESAGRLKTDGGLSFRIGVIGRKQIGGHVAFTRQNFTIHSDSSLLLPQQYKLNELHANVTGLELGGDFLFIRTTDTMLGMSIGIASSFGASHYLSVSNGGLNGGIFFNRKHFNFLFSMQKLRGEAFIYVDKGNGYYDSVYNVYSLINYTFGVGFTF